VNKNGENSLIQVKVIIYNDLVQFKQIVFF